MCGIAKSWGKAWELASSLNYFLLHLASSDILLSDQREAFFISGQDIFAIIFIISYAAT
jgi:hypothetical protein